MVEVGSLTFHSTMMGVISRQKSMTTWITLSTLEMVGVDQQVGGVESLPE